MRKIVLIGSRQPSTKNDVSEIKRYLEDNSNHVELLHWEDIVVAIKAKQVLVLNQRKPIDLNTIDLVIAFGWYKNGKKSMYRDLAYSVAMILKHHNVLFWNSEAAMQRSASKLSTLVQLAISGVPVPDTYFCLDKNILFSYVTTPSVIKAVAASRGDHNYFISDYEQLDHLKNNDYYMTVQPYLENDHDLRIICFNGKPYLILKRSRRSDTTSHMNNTSQGADAEWLDIKAVDEMLLTISENICKLMGREMAGIDFIPDKSSQFGYSCLEVNAIPQLSSGTDVNTKLTALKKSINELR